MIYLSIDSTSEAYEAGRALGFLLGPAVLMLVLWFATASWRRVSALPPGEAADGPTAALRVRRRRTVLIILGLLGAGAVVSAVLRYAPEPRAAETAGAASGPMEADAAPTGPRTITPPAALDGYRLMTEKETASYREVEAGRLPCGRTWYYDRDDDGRADGILHIDTTQWSQKLAEEKRRDSITQEFRNFFAGARSSDSAEYPSGPLGGRLACGHYENNPAMSMCAWSDASTLGTFAQNGVGELSEAARTTLDFRNASDQRT
ncbi:hypothetical protein ABZY44_03940 [Streptomyces sp. NPDC006544]|uniref:hypothetical protein n=1 Tax=Streptomyces sp. NPDC006544 TaxID=3154583 RepID=UPI0033B0F064